jgi:hypothetical protein
MTAALIYWPVVVIQASVCGFIQVLETLASTIGELFERVAKWILDMLAAICHVLSNIPLIGWLFGAICALVQAILTAALSVVTLVGKLTKRFVVGSAKAFGALLLVAAYGTAWLAHGALLRCWMHTECLAGDESANQPLETTFHFVVLANDVNDPEITPQQLDEFENRTRMLLAPTGVQASFTRSIVAKPELTKGISIAKALLPGPYVWLTCHSKVFEPTVYFIDEFASPVKRGLAIAFVSGFCFVRKPPQPTDDPNTPVIPPTVPVHEFGHLCDKWSHSPDPSRIMYSPVADSTTITFTQDETCRIRTSRFVTPA